MRRGGAIANTKNARSPENRGSRSPAIGKVYQHADRASVFSEIRIETILFLVFAVLLMLALGMGIVSFKSIYAVQNETNENRLALNSIQNRVRAHDCAESFSIEDAVEGKALVFTEELESISYETRIYLYNGYIVEESTFGNAPLSPDSATRIVASNTFDFTYKDNLLSLTTDQGTLNIALRSEQVLDYQVDRGDDWRRDA